MKKLFYIFIILMTISSCNSKKSANTMADLTPLLTTDSTEQINVNNENGINLSATDYKYNSYKLSNHSLTSSPIVADGKIFSVDNHGIVSAFSLDAKQTIWSNQIIKTKYGNSYIGGGLTYNNGKLYITNGSRYLVIIDASNGYEIVRKEFSDIIRTKPVILSSDIVLVQTVSNQIEVFNTSTAKTLSMHESYPETINSGYYMDPLIYNTELIGAYNTGAIFALDYIAGKEKWVVNISELLGANKYLMPGYEPCGIACAPEILDKSLYIATSLGQLMKINLDNGQIIWNKNVEDVQSMSIIGNSLFVTNNAHQIAALSLNDGSIKWTSNLTLNLKKNRNIFYSKPLVTVDNNGNKFLTILSSQNQSYNFLFENNSLIYEPIIYPMPKNVVLINNGQNANEKFIIANNQIIFLDNQ